MPRLFIAVDLPEEARDKLSDIAIGIPDADWVQSDQYHLTLRFLGEVDAPLFRDIRAGLAGVQARAFHLTLKGLGHFPLRGDPEVVWAGIEANTALHSLRNKVESAVARRGCGRDARKFHPHVTLAKVKGSRPDSIGRYFLEHALFTLPEIPVRTFGLYSSRLAPGGAIHTLEESYPLDGILEAE